MATSETLLARGVEKQQFVTLHSGAKMPQVGLGTWQSAPGEVATAVKTAISLGYRHIDCARCYQNEKEIGTALKEIFDTKKIERSELFVTSKLWNTFHHPDDVKSALKKTLEDLKLEYLDLYLIHWPMNFKRGDNLFPRKADGYMDFGEIIPIEDTWKAMEECVRDGLAKHIGISNFNCEQIDKIESIKTVPIAVLQCESHPYLKQKELLERCKKYGIAFTAYSPLGTPGTKFVENAPRLLDNDIIKQIAKEKNENSKENTITTAHVLIRWQIERGNIVIPKSVNPLRIKANMEVWDFKLNDKDLKLIDSIDIKVRYCAPKIKLDDGTSVPRAQTQI